MSSRTVRALALVVGAALALGACGGSSNKSGSSTTTAGSTASTVAASGTAAGKPWVDALVKSATADPNRPAGTSEQQVRCVANAIVDTFGAAAFPAAGYTIAKVSDPNSQLNKLPVTDAQLTALGKRVQLCRLGAFFAPQLAAQFPGATRADTNACITTHLDADAPAGRFLALGFLSRDPDRSAARAVVDLLAQCTDFAAVAGKNLTELTPAERACVAPKLAASSQFRDIVAEEIVGQRPTNAELVKAAVASMVGCVSAKRLAQLARQP